MTVIAWDGERLAADKRACDGNPFRTVTKIRRIGRALVAYSGDAAQGEEMMAWFERGADPDDFPESQRDVNRFAGLVVIRRARAVLRYEQTAYPVGFEDEICAFGSGGQLALAAMDCGKNAIQAVEIASRWDSSCGNGVDWLWLDPKKSRKIAV